MGDAYYSLRSLTKHPGFVLIAVLTLALGIGVNTAIFSIVNAIIFRPLPLEDSGRLVALFTTGEVAFIKNLPLSYPDYIDYRDQNEVFSGAAVYNTTIAVFGQNESAAMTNGEAVSGNFFDVLGIKPAAGRMFHPDDDRSGAAPVAILSYGAWQRRFGGDPSIIGRSVSFTGNPYTIVGIAPENFTGMMRGLSSEFWIPIVTESLQRGSIFKDTIKSRKDGAFSTIARLKPGVTLGQAQANLEIIAKRLEQTYPESNKGRGAIAIRANDIVIHPAADGAIMAAAATVMALSGVVLLIACANLANLLLARATTRRKEIAIRLALGESRRHLVQGLLFESVLLAVAGGALGLLLAAWCNRLLNVIQFPIPVQIALGLSLDSRVLAFTFAAALLTGVIFGLVPAWQATRVNVFPALKDEGASHSGGKRKARLRSALVVAQVTLSLVLLIFGGLALRSLGNAAQVDPGFNPNNLMTGSVAPALVGYDEARGRIFNRQLIEQIRSIPGVQSATMSTGLPLTLSVRLTRLGRADQPNVPESELPYLDTTNVWPGYFTTMEIPIVQGREFVQTDTETAPRVVVVNEALARAYWPHENPIGKRLLIYPNAKAVEIVGVAKDGKYRTLGEDPRPFVYANLLQDHEGLVTVVVRTVGDQRAALSGIRSAVRVLDPSLPVFNLQTVREHIGPSMLLPQYAATLFGAFGLIGAILAVVGLYGVISYSVSQRTQEMGIRIALGGNPGDVFRLVIGEGMKLTAIGLTLGLALALVSSRLLSVILYGVGSTDPVTFIGVSALMILVTLLACYIPARRATRVDPLVALRNE